MRIVSVDTEYAHYIPFIGTSTDEQLESTLYVIKKKSDFRKLKNLCESTSTLKVFHAAVNDIYALSNVGIKVKPPYACTMIAATLLNENYESKKLKVLAKEQLGEDCEEETALKKVKSKLRAEAKKAGKYFTYDMIPPKILYPYALKDTVYPMKLWYLYKKPLKKYQKLFDFEMELIALTVKMVQRGLRVDRKFVKKMIVLYKEEIQILYNRMLRLTKKAGLEFTVTKVYKSNNRERVKDLVTKFAAKHDLVILGYSWKDGANKILLKEKFNPNSDHLQQVITGLEIPITEKTKEEKYVTDKIVLDAYKEHSFIKYLLEYRFFTKQLNTYYEPLYNRYTSATNDRAHFMLYQTGAKTGRYSAELIQTMPKRFEEKEVRFQRLVRKAFIPDKDYVYVCIDYDQIEMRVFAHLANSRRMIKNINNNLDPHLGAAYDIYGKHIVEYSKNVKDLCRRSIKWVNFGIIYGMGVAKLTETINRTSADIREAIEKESGEQADLVIKHPSVILQEYHEKYPVKKYIAELTSELYRNGYITITVDSKLMSFTRDYRVPQELAYKAVNTAVQGLSAYIMKYGMKRAEQCIIRNRFDARLLLTIHDELMFEVHKSENLGLVIRRLTRAMEDRVTFKVPILAGAKTSDVSWADVKDYASN